MQISAQTSGSLEWAAALDVKARAVNHATARAGQKSGKRIVRLILAGLNAQSHAPGTRTPSLPGTPPARITGGLGRAVGTTSRWMYENIYRTQVYVNHPAARVQELGGRTGRGHRTVLPPRPYVKPAVRAALAEVQRIHRESWAGAIRV